MNVYELFRTLVAAPEDREVASAGAARWERASKFEWLIAFDILFSLCDKYLKVCAPLEKFLRTPMVRVAMTDHEMTIGQFYCMPRMANTWVCW